MKNCELCKFPARIYCESDRACICWDCDTKVHGANFLVSRHARNLLCQTCESITPWKATGARLDRTVSICDLCANGANLKKEKPEEPNDDVSTEDGDDLSTGDRLEDERAADNQVVPRSSASPPPAISSSSSSSSSSQETVSGFTRRVFCESVNVKSLKRSREGLIDLRSMFQVDADRSASPRCYGVPALTTQVRGGGGDGETVSVDCSLSWRPLKDRRTETECSFKAGSRSVAVIVSLGRFHQHSNEEPNKSETVDADSSGNASRPI